MNYVKTLMTMLLLVGWSMPTVALACMEELDSAAPPLSTYLINSYPQARQQNVPTDSTVVFVIANEEGLEFDPDDFSVTLKDEDNEVIPGELWTDFDPSGSSNQYTITIFWQSESDLDFDTEYGLRLEHHLPIDGLLPMRFRTAPVESHQAPRIIDFIEQDPEMRIHDEHRCQGANLVTEPTCSEITEDEITVRYRTMGVIDETANGGGHFVRLSLGESSDNAMSNHGTEGIDFSNFRPWATKTIDPTVWATDEVCSTLHVVRLADGETVIEEARCEPIDFESMLREANLDRQSAIATWYEANPIQPLGPESDDEIGLNSSGCEVISSNPLSPLAWLIFAGLFLNRRRCQ